MAGIALMKRPSWTKLKTSACHLYRGFLRCSRQSSDDVIAWFLYHNVKEEFQKSRLLDWRTAKGHLRRGWPLLHTARSAIKGRPPCLKKLILMSYGKEGFLAERIRALQLTALWRSEHHKDSELRTLHPLIRMSVFSLRSLDAKADYHAMLMQRAEKMDRRRLYWSTLSPIEEGHLQFLYLPAIESSSSSSSSSLEKFVKTYCERYSGFPFQRNASPALSMARELRPTQAPPGFAYPSLPVIKN